MTISRKATAAATQDCAAVHNDLSYSRLFPGGPLVSQAGFGTYRVAAGVDSHQQALAQALRQGINLIDTSSNYSDGRAEELIGQVVGELVAQGTLRRDALVIISKVGYIQGQNREIVAERKRDGNPFPNVVTYAEGLDHCIHPDFIEDQLGRSLARLKMECLDGYLLHNPEYYLMWAHKVRQPLTEARATYAKRIRLAFTHLEEEVARGRIQWYGISSNTFPSPADDPAFTSLEMAWQVAEEITPNHHFRLVQWPMNLRETGAITEKNQSDERSALNFARDKGLGVLVNRPLNAIIDGALTRLTDVPPPSYPATPGEVSTAVDTLVAAEVEFQQKILPQLALEPDRQRPLLEQLAIGRILKGQWRKFASYQNWRDVQTRYLIPRARSALHFLSNRPNLPPEADLWVNGYVDAVEIALSALSAFYQGDAVNEIQRIRDRIAEIEPEWITNTMSQTAVRALRSTAGVTSVLVGMRQPAYVDDVVAELRTAAVVKNRGEAWIALK